MGETVARTLPLLVLFVGGPALIWWLRKGGHGLAPALRVVGRTALTKTSVIAIVEADGERLLVGASEQGVTVLRTLDPLPAADTDPSAAPTDLLDIDRPWSGPLDALRAMTTRRANPPGPVRDR